MYVVILSFLIKVDFGNWDIIGGGCRNDEVVSNSTPATCTWLIAVSNMTAKTYSFYAKLRAFVSDHSKVTESDKISPDVPVVLSMYCFLSFIFLCNTLSLYV